MEEAEAARCVVTVTLRGLEALVAVLAHEVGFGLEIQVATAGTVVHEVGIADRGVGAGGVHRVLVERAVREHHVDVGDVGGVSRSDEPLVLVPAALVVAVEGEQVRGAEVGDLFAGGRRVGDGRAQPGVGLVGRVHIVPPEGERVADVDRGADQRGGRGAPDHREAVVEVVIVAHVPGGLVAGPGRVGRGTETIEIVVRVPDGLVAVGVDRVGVRRVRVGRVRVRVGVLGVGGGVVLVAGERRANTLNGLVRAGVGENGVGVFDAASGEEKGERESQGTHGSLQGWSRPGLC